MKKEVAFEFHIDSYDPIKQKYTLINRITKQTKILTKKEFEELYKIQYGNRMKRS